jgi:hypothetical protein
MAWGLCLDFVFDCVSILLFVLLWLGALLGCGCRNTILHWAKFLFKTMVQLLKQWLVQLSNVHKI